MDFTVNVYGLEEAMENLSRLPSLLVLEVFGDALELAGTVVQGAMQELAPVHKEGILKRAGIVDVTLDGLGQGGTARIGYNPQVKSADGDPADSIANWVEYGHLDVSHKGQPEGGYTPANPFMRPAAVAAGELAIEVFTEALDAGLERVSFGLPSRESSS